MKILICHNSYVFHGGEDVVFEDEMELLRSRGHSVSTFTRNNHSLANSGNLSTAINTIWNKQVYKEIRSQIAKDRPDVVHCHNTFPIISPSIYYAAKREQVPVVQTLHNFRLICPKAVLMRDGKFCEDCVGKMFAWSGVRNKCYRESYSATFITAAMLSIHRLRSTWKNCIAQYIALTDFSKRKYVSAGFSPEHISVKPNFVRTDHGMGDANGKYMIYVGRLSEEKGIQVLIDAWKQVKSDYHLRIVGEGPWENQLQSASNTDSRIEILGHLSHSRVMQQVANAKALLFPSIWYEGFGRSIIEAFSVGTPVIASDCGAMSELIQHDENGLLFGRGDACELAQQIHRILNDDGFRTFIRQNARDSFLQKYSADANYDRLIKIYHRAMGTEVEVVPPPIGQREASRNFVSPQQVREA